MRCNVLDKYRQKSKMIKIVYNKGLNEGVIDGLDRVRRKGKGGQGNTLVARGDRVTDEQVRGVTGKLTS